jgi:hypothetical protein
LLALASLAGLASVGSGVAGASPATSKPHMVPADTKISAALKKGTTFTSTATVNGTPVTVTCTEMKAIGKTPKDGLTAKLSAPPKYSGCKDSLGGTDTVTSSGIWSVTLNSTGTRGTLNVPKDAGTITSSVLPSCKITVSPDGPTKMLGSYNDVNTATISGASLPISASGCTVSSDASVSSTIVVTPGVSVQVKGTRMSIA